MATLVFSSLGASLGSSALGGVIGTSLGAIAGRAAGALFGRKLDNKLFGSKSRAPKEKQLDGMRVTTARTGEPIPEIYGRFRIAGQVIWAGNMRSYRADGRLQYSLSIALALTQGVVHRIGRVWADGKLVQLNPDSYRFYRGSEDQEQDPHIAVIEGKENTPRYAGLCYILFENLKLEDFGNRIPNFEFEIFRHANTQAQFEMRDIVSAVCLIPGTGEYALSTSQIYLDQGQGIRYPVNTARPGAGNDFSHSLTQLVADLPRLKSASLIVSWFGDDLRADHCLVEPRVEQSKIEGNIAWSVCGATRKTANLTSKAGDSPLYGGTPSDQSVIEAIKALRAAGKEVMFYPFILMDIPAGNTKRSPYEPGAFQPALPWRGRITGPLAPEYRDGPDDRRATKAAVEKFLGEVRVEDFIIHGDQLTYQGPERWSYRRFILHYAHLCKLAGGADQFLIGSELRGLSWLQDQDGGFPFVDGLIRLAREVRAILGPDTKISYAADWSEYFGFHPQSNPGDVYFHLDPLWADDAVDFIGIDNYMPLSDWRHESPHADQGFGSIYNLDYLTKNVAGGEGYDWYYKDQFERRKQTRSPIIDGHDEEWVWRYKDLKGWWSNPHFNRIEGKRARKPSPWIPQSKPFLFCEYGAAAIDLSTNQPNKFLDAKSSESALPHYSKGTNDNFIPQQYAKAINRYWRVRENNPISALYNGPMVDIDRAYYWCWDTRPWPEFPGRPDIWSDCENFGSGHWISERVNLPSLANVVAEICAPLGENRIDTSRLYGLMRGAAFRGNENMRQKLEELMSAHGFVAFFRGNKIHFMSLGFFAPAKIDEGRLLAGAQGARVTTHYSLGPERISALELRYADADGEYEQISQIARKPDARCNDRQIISLSSVLAEEEADGLAKYLLENAVASSKRISFSLPPSEHRFRCGDSITLPNSHPGEIYMIERIEKGISQSYEALRVPGAPLSQGTSLPRLSQKPFAAGPPLSAFFEASWLRGNQLYAAFGARPWNGPIELSIISGNGQKLKPLAIIPYPSTMGTLSQALTKGQAGRRQNSSVEIHLTSGEIDDWLQGDECFGYAAIGEENGAKWEVIGFERVKRLGQWRYELGGIIRGAYASEENLRAWQKGAMIVLLDENLIAIPDTLLGANERHHLLIRQLNNLDASEQEIWVDDPVQASAPLPPAALRVSRNRFHFFPRSRADHDDWRGADDQSLYPVNFHILAQKGKETLIDLHTFENSVDISAIANTGEVLFRAAAISPSGRMSHYNEAYFHV